MTHVSSINLASWVSFFISHDECSLISKGILNLEWVVLPPDSNNDAILDEATTKITLLLDLKYDIIVSYK